MTSVLHVGPYPDLGAGNGVDVAAWALMVQQAAAGARVTLLLGDLPPVEVREHADRHGVALRTLPSRAGVFAPRRVRRLIAELRPDVVHFHSVFRPGHAVMARSLPRGLPYVVSPHGGLNLFRGKVKKACYGVVVEKPYYRRAGSLVALTEAEAGLLRGWVGRRARTSVLPNMVAVPAEPLRWEPPASDRVVYIGRFDVYKKGLDRLVELARALPDLQVAAYGAAQGGERAGFDALLSAGPTPPNLAFCAPVYGAAKDEVLAGATMYVQLSRDEGFGMSIVEAMGRGIPTAVSRDCDLAAEIARNGAGGVLADPVEGLRAALADSAGLRRWSEAGRRWVTREFSPEQIAARSLEIYRKVCADCELSSNAPGV